MAANLARMTVFAGDPARAVGEYVRMTSLSGPVAYVYRWRAAMPDPWDGPRGPRMTYDDANGPVVFQSGIVSTAGDAVNAITRAAVGLVGADANVSVESDVK